MSKKISRKELLDRGWEYNYNNGFPTYENTAVRNGKRVFLTVNNFSNAPDRHWSLHIDNGKFETIGILSVETFEQIDRMIELATEPVEV